MSDLGLPASDRPSVSFEFFPPRTEKGFAALFDRVAEFESLEPSFVSVTYGAGGSTRDNTNALVARLVRETKLPAVPHLTCVGHTKVEIDAILQSHAEVGIHHVIALRGDPPAGDHVAGEGEFPYAADLVSHIRAFGDRHGHTFGIGVAGFPEGHPATPNALLQMDHLKAKVECGADWICTQLFFNNHAFLDWEARARLAGIKVPILAGIMPVTTLDGLMRMADLAAGMVFPASLLKALDRCDGDDQSVAEVGVHWATEQCRDLLDHDVDGLHFYTLNKSDATRRIHRLLGVKSARSLRQ
jgi:methylenetetrahydrofolate reductase (NADPH)